MKDSYSGRSGKLVDCPVIVRTFFIVARLLQLSESRAMVTCGVLTGGTDALVSEWLIRVRLIGRVSENAMYRIDRLQWSVN